METNTSEETCIDDHVWVEECNAYKKLVKDPKHDDKDISGFNKKQYKSNLKKILLVDALMKFMIFYKKLNFKVAFFYLKFLSFLFKKKEKKEVEEKRIKEEERKKKEEEKRIKEENEKQQLEEEEKY